MVVSSLVMAAGVAVTALVAMLGRMPFRRKAGHGDAHDGAHHEAESGASQLNVVDIIFIVIFAVAGGFAFNVLANAGGG
jgi:hypothetical protein